MNDSLNELEATALVEALRGPDEWREHLRQQIPLLRVLSRRHTGYGFFLNFRCVDCDSFRNDSVVLNSEVPTAWATHPNVDGGIVVLVYLEGGLISRLEVASTTIWPEDFSEMQFETN